MKLKSSKGDCGANFIVFVGVVNILMFAIVMKFIIEKGR